MVLTAATITMLKKTKKHFGSPSEYFHVNTLVLFSSLMKWTVLPSLDITTLEQLAGMQVWILCLGS